jgi:WXXGXW repeat (2 copies)
MKTMFKTAPLGLAVSLTAEAGYAQIYVNVRPVVPHYERVAAPSPRHVWIDEEWEPRGGAYVFVGGHWAAPPRPGVVWVPGHWRQRPRGWVWVPGHWR